MYTHQLAPRPHPYLTPIQPMYAESFDGRRRRRRGAGAHRRPMPMHAGAMHGATLLHQQLPFRVGVSVRVSNSLLYPALGAVAGGILFGLPGALLGGIGGYLLTQRRW